MERASIKSILFQASITSEERYGFKMSIFTEKSERQKHLLFAAEGREEGEEHRGPPYRLRVRDL